MMRFGKWLFSVFAAAMVVGSAEGAVFTYTFESSSWNTTTPLVNLAPDLGPVGFSTTFTASPLTNSFEVNRWNAPSLISGNNLLFNPAYISSPPGNLTLGFSTNASSVSMVIEIAAGANGVTITNEQGDSQFFGVNQYDQGIPVIQVSFTPAHPFSSMNLGFAPTGEADTFFAIDNIAITAPSGPPPRPGVQVSGHNLVLTWPAAYTLQASSQPGGGFTNVVSATSPYTNAMSGPQMFFRLKEN